MSGCRNRIDSGIRPGGVPSSSVDFDRKIATKSAPGAGSNSNLPFLSIRIDMQSQDAVNALQCAFLYQLLSALPLFFARLEDDAPREW